MPLSIKYKTASPLVLIYNNTVKVRMYSTYLLHWRTAMYLIELCCLVNEKCSLGKCLRIVISSLK